MGNFGMFNFCGQEFVNSCLNKQRQVTTTNMRFIGEVES